MKEQQRKDILYAAAEKDKEKREMARQEKELEATEMARAQQEYAVQQTEAAARKDASQAKIQRELELQIQYTKMIKESQKELDIILTTLGSSLI